MANAPVSGEYPKEHQTPALTQPFAKSVSGFPVTVDDLADPKHPINIRNISGKGRGATILLDDDTVYWATGHLASDPWLPLGSGGSGGEPEGMVKSVNGVKPTANGNVAIKVGVKTINGVEPDAAGDSKVEVHNLHVAYKGTAATYTLTEADRDTLLIFNTASLALTLPAAIKATDPAKVFYVTNTGGGVELTAPTGNLIAYAPHADKNVTIGIVRASDTDWVATGTNIPEELS